MKESTSVLVVQLVLLVPSLRSNCKKNVRGLCSLSCFFFLQMKIHQIIYKVFSPACVLLCPASCRLGKSVRVNVYSSVSLYFVIVL